MYFFIGTLKSDSALGRKSREELGLTHEVESWMWSLHGTTHRGGSSFPNSCGLHSFGLRGKREQVRIELHEMRSLLFSIALTHSVRSSARDWIVKRRLLLSGGVLSAVSSPDLSVDQSVLCVYAPRGLAWPDAAEIFYRAKYEELPGINAYSLIQEIPQKRCVCVWWGRGSSKKNQR